MTIIPFHFEESDMYVTLVIPQEAVVAVLDVLYKLSMNPVVTASSTKDAFVENVKEVSVAPRKRGRPRKAK
jgi:hypothetical protein